jgi:hypothetical protein
MVRKPSACDIRDLGFDWPKYALIEEYRVIEDGKVDLKGTGAGDCLSPRDKDGN